MDIQECGMLLLKQSAWLSCSPDGVVDIDAHFLGICEDVTPQLPSVEIKTSVASFTLEKRLIHSSVGVKVCTVEDADYFNLVPRQHCGQLLHQAAVLQVQFIVHVSASDTVGIYCAVWKVPQFFSSRCLQTF